MRKREARQPRSVKREVSPETRAINDESTEKEALEEKTAAAPVAQAESGDQVVKLSSATMISSEPSRKEALKESCKLPNEKTASDTKHEAETASPSAMSESPEDGPRKESLPGIDVLTGVPTETKEDGEQLSRVDSPPIDAIWTLQDVLANPPQAPRRRSATQVSMSTQIDSTLYLPFLQSPRSVTRLCDDGEL